MTINRKIVPRGLKNNPDDKLESISFITVHLTNNYTETTTAKAHADRMYSGWNGQIKSWHYTVDKDEIWQHFEDNELCMHTDINNNKSIGIKICVNDKAGLNDACKNAALLVSKLLKEYKLSINNIIPDTILLSENNNVWKVFLQMV